MKKFDIESLKLFVGDFTDVQAGSMKTDNVETDFQLKPADFLSFAKHDLNDHCDHHLINAISNIKRAIECQIDSLLVAFSLFGKSKEERWSFPAKADFLNNVGVISPPLLKKINRIRNLVEHEYQRPNDEKVEDAFDVATLFLDSSGRFLNNALRELEVIHEGKQDSFTIWLDYHNGKIILLDSSTMLRGLADGMKEIALDSVEYEEFLKFYISLYRLR